MSRSGYVLRTVPAALMFVLLAAHFLRWSQVGLVAVALAAPLLLVSRRKWTPVVVQLLLAAGALVWVQTAVAIVQQRLSAGVPWGWAAAIMAAVTLATLGAAALLRSERVRARHRVAAQSAGASAAAFCLVFGIGAFPHLKMRDPVPLIAERFLPGSGWGELLLLAIYAAWLVEKLLDAGTTDRIRRNVWAGFSLVFFLQLALGVAGVAKLLMTGALHLPVPAMIAAGPFFRGETSFFMPILLGVTLLVAGPAWCSWFCYLGSWDFIASRSADEPGVLPRHPDAARIAILILLCGGAAALRMAGVPALVAASLGILFGIGGVAVMLLASRRTGIMVHCTAYCPIGLIATVVGKINPLRVRIGGGCTQCQSCIPTCRYGALTETTLRQYKPGPTCTLCGDCLSACPGAQIGYRFPGLTAAGAKRMFFAIAASVHALFIGFGRI